MTINIPYHAPAAPQAHPGLLYAPDLIWWLYGAIVLTLALFLMPGQLRESIKALYAPLGSFLRSLCCPWLWAGVFVHSFLAGAYRGCENISLAFLWNLIDWGREQLRRLAVFWGFEQPCLT